MSPTRPSLFLDQRPAPVAGTAITVTLDGKRPLIGEVQALLATPSGGSPRRAVSGIDHARAAMITAVLEKHARLNIAVNDIYLSTVGGMRLTDPSSDLAVAIALASAYANLPLPTTAVMIGEVGLAGDLRRVSGMERRLAEAARQGFNIALIPPGADPRSDVVPPGMRALQRTHHRRGAGAHDRHRRPPQRRAPARPHRLDAQCLRGRRMTRCDSSDPA